MIPDGPLHPGDLVIAFVSGCLIGRLSRSTVGPGWGTLLIVILVFGARHGFATVTDGYFDRASASIPAATTVAVGVVGGLWSRSVAVSTTTFAVASLAATAMVWAVVPDTEAAVIAVGVVLSRLVVSGRPAEPIDPLDAAGLAALTQVAAVLGSVGRTSTFAPAAVLASGSLAAVVLVPVAVKGARSVSGRVHPHTSSEP